MLNIPCMVYVLCLLCPGITEDFPLVSQMLWRMHTTIIRHGRFSFFSSRHVLRAHQCTFEAAKGTLHSHVASDQEVVLEHPASIVFWVALSLLTTWKFVL